MEKKIEELNEVVKIQCSSGNWNYDNYMHGMANGLILARAIMLGVEPKFLEAPKKWLKNRPNILIKILWKLFPRVKQAESNPTFNNEEKEV